MLKVTVELLPGGREEDKKLLGTVLIANIGGTETQGRYLGSVWGKRGRYVGQTEIKKFPRKRLLAWDLVYRVLRNVLGDRNV